MAKKKRINPDAIQYSHKQLQYVRNANRRWNFKIGAVRSGKSFIDIAYIIPARIRAVSGKPGLTVFFGVSWGTIERNILQPMREIYTDRLVGYQKSSKQTVTVFGEEVYCIGVEKSNAVKVIQGMSIKYAYGDEIAKWNKDVFAMIESRLDKEYSCFDGACNPEGPNHWFKKWLDNPKLNAYIQPYVIWDNPFLPKNYVRDLCNEYEGTVYYQRYILGKWAIAEGIVYPHYMDAIQKAPDDAIYDNYVLSIDYGTENAFAGILWARNERDRVWYALREYYYSGRTVGVPKTDEEYADDMEIFVADILDEYDREYTASSRERDLFAARKKLLTIVDPSATSFITALQNRKKFKIRKANNDVMDGIRNTAVAMRLGSIKIDPGMKNWIDEASGYSWNGKSADKGVDEVIKENDHLMDSMRYFVQTMHIVQKARKNG